MPTFYAPGTRKGNRFYIVRGSVYGRECEITTKRTDKKLAKADWDAFVVQAEKQERTKPQRLVTFADVADGYLLASTRSHRTRRFIEKLQKDVLGQLRVEDVRYSDLLSCANRLYPNTQPQTQNRAVLKPAAAVLHFAAQDGLRNYMAIPRLKEPEPEARRPRAGVAETLLANTEGYQHLLLTFLFYQGWRIQETLSLRWENISLRERSLKVYIGKIKKWKSLVMSEEVAQELQQYAKEGGPVFPWSYRNSVYNWLAPLCKRLDVSFTPHMARHDFASQLRERGATGRDLVDVCTWSSERSTWRYQNPSTAHSRSVISRRKVGEPTGENGKKREISIS